MATTREFGVGSVLGRSFPIWLRNLVPFTILSVIVYLPLIAYTYVHLQTPEPSASAARNYQIVSNIGGYVLSMLVSGAVIYGVFQQLQGRTAGIGDCMVTGLKRIAAILGVGVLVGILVFAGTLALFVPGIILACMYWVAVPVSVVERPGVLASLRRSAVLTKGQRGTIFLIMLVLQLLGFVFGLVMGVALGRSGLAFDWLLLSISILLGTLTAVTVAVGYHDLRVAKEGVGIDELVAVFE